MGLLGFEPRSTAPSGEELVEEVLVEETPGKEIHTRGGE